MRLAIIAGARPNFMKVAPVSARSGLTPGSDSLVHTGQHYDAAMSDVFFVDLGHPRPDVTSESAPAATPSRPRGDDRVRAAGSSSTAVDAVVVVGDVNSTVACTLVAAKTGDAGRTRRSGPAVLRPHDAGGDQPHRGRRPVDLAVHAVGGWRRQPACRRHRPGPDPPASATSWSTALFHPRSSADLLDGRSAISIPTVYGLVTLHRPALVDDPEQLPGTLATLGRVECRPPARLPGASSYRGAIDSMNLTACQQPCS